MRESTAKITRRQTLAGLGGVSAIALLPGCAAGGPAPASVAGPIRGLAPDAALDAIAGGMFSPLEPARHEPIVASLLAGGDRYLLLADPLEVPAPGAEESQEVRWFSWAEAAAIADAGLVGALLRAQELIRTYVR